MTDPDVSSLIAQLIAEDDHVAERAAQAIIALGEFAIPALFDCLESDDANSRWWALRTLAEIQHPSVPPRLQLSLKDTDPSVQQCAALGLNRQPRAEATTDLINLLGNEDRLLSRLAADALIAIGKDAVPHLIQVLENGPPPAKTEAVRSLAIIANPEAIPALFKAWHNGSSIIQYWVEQGFDHMGIGMQFFQPD
jgi:HEAT repeat protein